MGALPRVRVLRGALLLVIAALLVTLLPAPGAVAAAPSAGVPSVVGGGLSREQPAPGEDFPRLPAQCYDENDVIKTQPCRITRFSGRPMLVVWGDSHAQMYLSSLVPLAKRQRVNLVAIIFGGCPVSWPYPRSSGRPQTGCDKHNLESLDYVRELTQRRKRVRLLVNGFWSGYRQAYALVQREERTGRDSGLSDYREHMARLAVERSAKMFKAIGRLGVPTDLVGQAAMVPLDARRCPAGREPYQCNLPRRRALMNEGDNRRWMQRTLASRLPGKPRIIDASATYCNRKTCFAHVKGANTFFDDIHLGAALTRTMQSYFRPVYRDLTRR